MLKLIVYLVAIITLVFTNIETCSAAGAGPTVNILQQKGYYKVNIDLTAVDGNRRLMGKAYGKQIKATISNYEYLIDSYFQNFLNDDKNYNKMLERMRHIWKNVPAEVQDEINGITDTLCSTNENIMGDNLLSPDEFRMLNLLADTFRATNCSAVGVMPAASASGKLILARNVDWDDGKEFQLSSIQAVIRYKLGEKHYLTMISYVGLVTALTGINQYYSENADGPQTSSLFFALLDSDIGHEYSDIDKRSYPSDLRKYAEDCKTPEQLAAALEKTAKQYAFGFLVFMADNNEFGVFEDNLTYAPSNMRKISDNANLYLPWKIADTIGAVNCFMLKNSLDNTMGVDAARSTATQQNLQTGDNALYVGNVKRWATQQRLLKSNGSKHSIDDLKKLAGFGPGKATDGFIYRPSTQQITIFEPASSHLEIFFHPIGRDIGDKESPTFTNITFNDK